MNLMDASERGRFEYRFHTDNPLELIGTFLLGGLIVLAFVWRILNQYRLANTVKQTVDRARYRLHSSLPSWLKEGGSENKMYNRTEPLRKLLGFEGAPLVRSLVQGDGLRFKGAGRKPPGLGNWDNSCYQNSIIQGLSSLQSFQTFLSAPTSNFHHLQKDSTIHSLHETLSKLTDPANRGHQFWLPSKLKSMSSWQQQDAQEYFSKIMDQVDQEARKATKLGAAVTGLESLLEPDGSTSTRKTTPEPSPNRLNNPLEGMLAQRVGCVNCGYSEGLSMIPFNCLTVPLGRGHAYDIRDCLDEYTKLEHIEGVQCAKCSVKQHLESCRKMIDSKKEDPTSSAFHEALKSRVDALQAALDDEDFSDDTLTKKCRIPKRQWVASTKSRQAVIARPPPCLVFHINRSVFDEMTGAQWKNYAIVQFPMFLDLSDWVLGSSPAPKSQSDSTEAPKADAGANESWIMDPNTSMIANSGDVSVTDSEWRYQLRAAITHYGRHENGHYICFRKHPICTSGDGDASDDVVDALKESWWRLSDEDVGEVSEEDVLSQGGVFMLFYERIPYDRMQVRPEPAQDQVSAQETSDAQLTPAEADSTTPLPTPAIPSEQGCATELVTEELHREPDHSATPEEQSTDNARTQPSITPPQPADNDESQPLKPPTERTSKPAGSGKVPSDERAPSRMRTAPPTAAFQSPKVRMVSI